MGFSPGCATSWIAMSRLMRRAPRTAPDATVATAMSGMLSANSRSESAAVGSSKERASSGAMSAPVLRGPVDCCMAKGAAIEAELRDRLSDVDDGAAEHVQTEARRPEHAAEDHLEHEAEDAADGTADEHLPAVPGDLPPDRLRAAFGSGGRRGGARHGRLVSARRVDDPAAHAGHAAEAEAAFEDGRRDVHELVPLHRR